MEHTDDLGDDVLDQGFIQAIGLVHQVKQSRAALMSLRGKVTPAAERFQGGTAGLSTSMSTRSSRIVDDRTQL
jgi:hypothetical protein